MEKENEIRYFSMFTGVGGFELGLEGANDDSETRGQGQKEGISKQGMPYTISKSNKRQYTCVGVSEFNKYSNQVLKYRFPNIKNWGDCTKIRPEDLPDFDMLCGGFPCQAFSIAGKRRGFEDTRGTMFFEIARILEVKRPKIVLLENVKGLLNHNKGETFRVILQTLDELGYEVQWMVLNSKFFGVPQNRERVFIIGSLRGEHRSEILPFGGSNENINEQNSEICQCIRKQYYKGANGTHIRAVLTPDRANKRQNGRRFKEPGEPSFTIKGQDIHGVTEGFKIRRLTPIECERLQGFPDNWTKYGIDEKGNKVKMSDTQRYKQMGNAVTTKVVQAIGRRILQSFINKENINLI